MLVGPDGTYHWCDCEPFAAEDAARITCDRCGGLRPVAPCPRCLAPAIVWAEGVVECSVDAAHAWTIGMLVDGALADEDSVTDEPGEPPPLDARAAAFWRALRSLSEAGMPAVIVGPPSGSPAADDDRALLDDLVAAAGEVAALSLVFDSPGDPAASGLRRAIERLTATRCEVMFRMGAAPRRHPTAS